jgi:hypothetical protein
MSEDLKSQLAKAAAALELLTYSNLSIEDSYARYCKELAGLKINDCRGQTVVLHERNFPKFLAMKRVDPATGEVLRDQNGKPIKAKASVVLASLKAGTFDSKQYYVEYGRLRTMFWIPDVLKNADGVYPNGHGVIEGDHVYAKKYEKKGSEIKLVYTVKDGSERVVITSFLVKESQLENYIGYPAIWPPNKKAT